MRYSGFLKCYSVMLAVILGLFLAQEKISAAPCPCDIYAAGGTPCVAAFSTVRALFASYNGPLYRVIRMSDRTTMDINTLTAGGYANAAAQDAFLQSTTGKVQIIYDQSGHANDLTRAPAGCTVNHPDSLSPASAQITIGGGHKTYGLYMNNGDGYRKQTSTSGTVATGSQPQGVYWVVAGKRYSGQGCCWDFGNAETNNCYGATGIMSSLFFGTMSYWGTGTGNGPWLMGDFEGGLWPGGSAPCCTKGYATNPTITFDYLTGILKNSSTPSANYALRYGNAQSGNLTTIYNGAAPTTWKQEGSIILGIGGDNSNGAGVGNFYEGAMTSGYPADTTENAVQRNIVAVYSNTSGTEWSGAKEEVFSVPFKVRYNPSTGSAVIGYVLQDARRVSMNIFDQQGRQIAAIADGVVAAGRHEAVWDARRVPAGVYACRIKIDGNDGWTGKVVIGR
jgi:non-reducing end alpha-L-arabinofuranosidase